MPRGPRIRVAKCDADKINLRGEIARSEDEFGRVVIQFSPDTSFVDLIEQLGGDGTDDALSKERFDAVMAERRKEQPDARDAKAAARGERAANDPLSGRRRFNKYK